MLRLLSWAILWVPAVAGAQSGFDYESVYTDGLKAPMDFAFVGGAGDLLVADQCGAIQHFSPSGQRDKALDLSGRVRCDKEEAGLIGIAAPRVLDADGWIYVYYTVKGVIFQRVSRIPVHSADGKLSFDAASEQVLLDELPWNLAKTRHSGGLALGVDDTLFVAVGDNGQTHKVQDLAAFQGKILRLSRAGGAASGNPTFEGSPVAGLFAVGFGRPWRIAVDPQDGTLWVGDRGDLKYEEIDRVVGGQNYGWPTFEGAGHTGPGGGTEVDAGTAKDPAYEYHSQGGAPVAVVVGAPYRAPEGATHALPPNFEGAVPVCDVYSNWLRFLQPAGESYEIAEFSPGMSSVRAIATGPQGRLWFVEYLATKKHQISRITWNDKAPVASILEPTTAHRYVADETLTLKAEATDAEEGEITADDSFQWTVTLFGADDATLDTQTISGRSADYVLPAEVDIQGRLELELRVTDSVGGAGTASVTLDPKASQVTFGTDPGGIEFKVDGETYTEKVTKRYPAGWKVDLSATQDVVFDGSDELWTFRKWTDGTLERETRWTVPDTDGEMLARYAIHGATLPDDDTGSASAEGGSTVELPPAAAEVEDAPPSDGCIAGGHGGAGWQALALLLLLLMTVRRIQPSTVEHL